MECELLNIFINNEEEMQREQSVKLEELQQHRDPFELLDIADNSFLNDIDGRSACFKCHKSRKIFCYSCLVANREVAELLPNVKLPLKIDIIKHRKETDGKSTATHAAILAPDDVSIYTYPDIPDYEDELETTLLIFPSLNCTTVHGVFDHHVKLQRADTEYRHGHNEGTLLKHRLSEVHDGLEAAECPERRYTLANLPIKRAVFIDSTWNQSRGIYKDARLNRMRTAVLQHRLSQFWRHQKNSPRWYLATIEAVHQLLLEIHVNAWGLSSSYRGLDVLDVDLEFARNRIVDGSDCRSNDVRDDSDSSYLTRPYDGQYDNLLFFFTHMYKLIHTYYDHNDLEAYRRPIG